MMADRPGSPGNAMDKEYCVAVVDHLPRGHYRTAGATDLLKALSVTQHGHGRDLRVRESGEVGCAVGVMLRS